MKDISPHQVSSELRAHAQRTERALVRASRAAALIGERVVVEATPSDTGEARRGWRVVLMPDGAELVNDAPHALILEFGSLPHRPPLMPILRWVMRVAFDGQAIDDIGAAPPEAVAMARAVVEKIASEGTEPHWMVRSNLARLGKILAQTTQFELERVGS